MTIDWYQGDVATSVAEAKKQHASLLIFVAWEDDYTKLYEQVLDTMDISGKLCIALRIAAYSDAFDQLKAIYRIVPVPCVLVIDWETGMVMERVAGPVFDQELQEAVLSVMPNRPPEKQPTPEPIPEPQVKEEKPEETKIQFKLLSGQSKMQVFSPEDKLALLRKKAAELFELTCPFDLVVPYPRRSLTIDQDGATLTALGLSPASAILIIPHEGSVLLPWSIFQALGRFIQPIFTIFQEWWQRFFASGPKPTINPVKKNN